MGIVSANAEWWPKLRETYDLMAMLRARKIASALRGLRTLSIRLKEAQSRALDIAHWLKARPEVIRVLHPAFEDCGTRIWKRDFTGSSGLFSVVLDPKFTQDDVGRLLDGLSIFGMGYSGAVLKA